MVIEFVLVASNDGGDSCDSGGDCDGRIVSGDDSCDSGGDCYDERLAAVVVVANSSGSS
ncbi:hypothetical protein HAX54_000465, partial [Datura stramonium]|nr:hypothetical protein [Datura stramonium]